MNKTSIKELHLSTRCRNTLWRHGITSVDMLEKSAARGHLKVIVGVGDGCIAEINRELKRTYGFRLPHIKLPHIKVVWK